MAYLIFAFVMAAALIAVLFLTRRESTDTLKSVDSFRRAIDALAPEREGKDRG